MKLIGGSILQRESLHILSINNFSNVNERIEKIHVALKDRSHKVSILGDKIMIWTYEEDVTENIEEQKEKLDTPKCENEANKKEMSYMDFIYGMKKVVQRR